MHQNNIIKFFLLLLVFLLNSCATDKGIVIKNTAGEKTAIFKPQKSKVLNINWFKSSPKEEVNTATVDRAVDFIKTHTLSDITLSFPKGVYVFNAPPNKKGAIAITSNLTIIGVAGETIFKLAANQPKGTKIINIEDQTNITIKDIIFDGNYKNQQIDKPAFHQLHALRIHRSSNITITACQFLTTAGDGIYIDGLKKSSKNIQISHCLFDNNQRNGITLGSGFEKIIISNNTFEAGIRAQPIDTEPPYQKTGKSVRIDNNIIRRKEGTHTRLAVVSAKFDNYFVEDYEIINNQLYNCSILLMNAKNIRILNNKITCNSPKTVKDAPITLWGKVEDIRIENNQITVQQASGIYTKAIVKKGNYPANIQIDRNHIQSSTPKHPIIYFESNQTQFDISNNELEYIDSGGLNGIYLKEYSGTTNNLGKVTQNNFKNVSKQLQVKMAKSQNHNKKN